MPVGKVVRNKQAWLGYFLSDFTCGKGAITVIYVPDTRE